MPAWLRRRPDAHSEVALLPVPPITLRLEVMPLKRLLLKTVAYDGAAVLVGALRKPEVVRRLGQTRRRPAPLHGQKLATPLLANTFDRLDTASLQPLFTLPSAASPVTV